MKGLLLAFLMGSSAMAATIGFEEAGTKFNADLVIPKGQKTPSKLVVIVHEWWGKNEYVKMRADKLNKAGHATLTVDLYGNGKTAETPDAAKALAGEFYKNPQIGVDRLNKYIDLAKKEKLVDPKQVYAIGYCFGGSQVLNLVRSGADIKGGVSFHGGLASPIKAHHVIAETLVLNGAADPMVPKTDIDALKTEFMMIKAKLQVISYEGALHAFTNPKATEVGKKYKMPVAYDEKADKASWSELLAFLKK